MGRLIIISNRLPFSLDREGDKLSMRQSSGGLVSAVKSYFEHSAPDKSDKNDKRELTEKVWMGVADFPREDWDEVVASQGALQEFNVIPLFIDKELYNDYYNGF
jgi:trehalose 6-phosphate synthase/phosphatase